MVGRLLLAAALSASALALPARAAELSTLDCVSESLDAAVRTQIEADVARNMAASGQKPSYDAAVGTGLSAAVAKCGAQHQWSAAAARAAGIYALARIGMPIAQRVVGEGGFDPAALEDRFQALPEEVRNRPLSAAAVQDLVRESVTDEARQTRANAELLAEFFAFLGTLQYAAHDFSEG